MYKNIKINLLRRTVQTITLPWPNSEPFFFHFSSFSLFSYFLLLKLLAEFQVNVILEKIIAFVGA